MERRKGEKRKKRKVERRANEGLRKRGGGGTSPLPIKKCEGQRK